MFFGRRPALYYGKKSHNIEKFYLALDRFMDMLHDTRGHAHRDLELQRSSLERVEVYGARVIHQLQSELLDMDQRDVPARQKTLDYLICKLTAFDAGDPRDVIFGVHSLARKTESTHLPAPNYTTSVLDVFSAFVEYSITSTSQLDIICCHWAPVHTHLLVNYNRRERQGVRTYLPSWIGQLNRAPFGPPSDVFLGRINGTPFIGDTASPYHASRGIGETKISARFGKHAKPRVIREVLPSRAERDEIGRKLLTESYNGTLEVRGLVLGVITERSDRMIPEIIPRDALRLGGWQFSRFEGHNELTDVPDQLWKTLIGNRHLDGKDADFGDKAACLAMLKREDLQGDIRIRDLLRDPYIFGNPRRNNYLERTRVVCWNRRAFIGGLPSPTGVVACDNGQYSLC